MVSAAVKTYGETIAHYPGRRSPLARRSGRAFGSGFTRLKGYPAASASAVYFFGSLSKFALQPAEQK
jgi:hypothetical protein